MSSNYVPSNQEGSFALNILFAVLITVGLFAIMPLMQFIEGRANTGPNLAVEDTSLAPPPPPPEEQPPPPEQEEDVDEPEMEEPPPPMTLAQLEMALNPGAGDAVGDFGFGDFNSGIDALAGMKIFSLADVDKKPRAIAQAKPIYPYSLQKSKIKGEVLLEFILDDKGKVHRPVAISSSHRDFEQPAIDAVRRWIFEPARKDGKPVAVNRVRVRIDFTL